MTKALGLAALLVCGPSLFAHPSITTKITWSREISRIFERHCMGCHQSGGKAPFALTDWDEARPWAVAIRDEVLSRRMPPWSAVKGFGDLKDDLALTQEQIQLIADWVNGGAPEGDTRLLSGKLPKAWNAPDLPPVKALRLSSTLLLATPVELIGLEVASLPEGASAVVTLQRPDSSVEPLLWIKDYNPAFRQPYLLRTPLLAPAGSRLRVASKSPVTLSVLTSPRPPKRRPSAPAPSPRPAPAGE